MDILIALLIIVLTVFMLWFFVVISGYINLNGYFELTALTMLGGVYFAMMIRLLMWIVL